MYWYPNMFNRNKLVLQYTVICVSKSFWLCQYVLDLSKNIYYYTHALLLNYCYLKLHITAGPC